jgi:hypothetical protein
MLEITPPFLKNVLTSLHKLKDAGIEALVIDARHSQVQIAARAMDLPFVQGFPLRERSSMQYR